MEFKKIQGNIWIIVSTASISNWTLGCVSLENKDVEELYQFVQKGTAVEIIK